LTMESQLPTKTNLSGAVLLPASPGTAEMPVARRAPWLAGMHVRRDAIFRKLLVLADVAAAATGLAVIGLIGGHGTPAASLLTLPLIAGFAKMTGRYERDELVLRKSTLEELPALLTLAGADALAWSLITYIAGAQTGLRGAGVPVFWAATATALVIARAVSRRLAQLAAPVERVLIVGGSAARALLASSLATDPTARLEVVGFLPLEDERRVQSDWGQQSRRRQERTFDDLPAVVRELEVHRVFLIPTHADGETVLEAVRRTAALGIKVSLVPRLFEVVGSAVAFDMVGGVTVLGIRQPGLSRSSRATKRAMDIVGSTVCLLALSPLIAAVAVAIKLDAPGPVFFRQRRVGRDGEHFGILKFRSMVDGAEARREALESLNESIGNFKLAADPRVTRIGRLLRRTSIDELPQLINVLKGDMSLVGPRPLVIAEDQLVEGRHRSRLHLAPGITGPWQVLGPARPPLSEMVKTDYLYAINWSIWADIKLLLRTLSHVAARRGL
jgi:exopolysaccharide biosynthesis polyprenyl glycosylphosphotransferase